MGWWSAKRRPPSLARRIIFGLVALQALVELVALLAEPVVSGRLPLRQWLAAEQASQLVAASIGRKETGELALVPTPEMTAYLKANPNFWFFASDGTELLRGGVDQPRFERGPDGQRVDPRQGSMFALDTAVGRVSVMLGGQHGEFFDSVWAWLRNRLRLRLIDLAVAAIGVTVVIVPVVQFLLRPVRRAARAAMALEPGQSSPALPVQGVPAEILPLVSATNAAFVRLEREHNRQRQFIANAAHELRTPIAILGIRLDELPEGRVKQRLRLDVRRLTMLANQLLDLQRLQHGGAAAPDRTVDMVALVRDVAAEMGPLVIDGGGNLSFCTARAQLKVAGDEQALRGVFHNLIGNALAHGGKGIKIEVRIEADGAIVVADRGAGVKAEDHDRVFEAFQRATSGEGAAGAGLGLYIVREVLAAHGAQIELRDGRPGAVFRIRF